MNNPRKIVKLSERRNRRSRSDTEKKTLRISKNFLMAIAVLFSVAAVYFFNSYSNELNRLNAEKIILTKDIETLKYKNQLLEEKLKSLDTREGIIREAREKLKLVMPGEEVIKIQEK